MELINDRDDKFEKFCLTEVFCNVTFLHIIDYELDVKFEMEH